MTICQRFDYMPDCCYKFSNVNQNHRVCNFTANCNAAAITCLAMISGAM